MEPGFRRIAQAARQTTRQACLHPGPRAITGGQTAGSTDSMIVPRTSKGERNLGFDYQYCNYMYVSAVCASISIYMHGMDGLPPIPPAPNPAARVVGLGCGGGGGGEQKRRTQNNYRAQTGIDRPGGSRHGNNVFRQPLAFRPFAHSTTGCRPRTTEGSTTVARRLVFLHWLRRAVCRG